MDEPARKVFVIGVPRMRKRSKRSMVILRVRRTPRTTTNDRIIVGIVHQSFDLLLILLSRGRGRVGRGSFPNGGNRGGGPTLPASSLTTPLSPVHGPTRDVPPHVNAWSRGGAPSLRTNGRPSAVTPNQMHPPSASTPVQGNVTDRGGRATWAPARGRRPT
jgi:hypothetical protein